MVMPVILQKTIITPNQFINYLLLNSANDQSLPLVILLIFIFFLLGLSLIKNHSICTYVYTRHL
jgi:hypothetical protein